MAAKLTLNKFELMWLFEGAAGKSHLRWGIYEMFVNKVWPQLTQWLCEKCDMLIESVN